MKDSACSVRTGRVVELGRWDKAYLIEVAHQHLVTVIANA